MNNKATNRPLNTASLKDLLVISLLFLGAVVSGCCLLFRDSILTIRDFSDHIISYASAKNHDIDSVTTCYLIFLICSFAGIMMCFRKTKPSEEEIECKDSLSAVYKPARSAYVFSALLAVIGIFFSDTISKTCLITLISVGIYFCKRHSFSLEDLCHVFAAGYSLSTIFLYVICFAGIYLPAPLRDNILTFLIVIGICFLRVKSNKIFSALGNIICMLLIWMCLFTEISYTYITRNNKSISLGIILIGIAGTAVMIIVGILVSCKKPDYMNKCFWVLSIIGITWSWNLRSLAERNILDIFEGANHGISIVGFVRFGEIPILDNMDPHMLSNIIPGILYYFINNDLYGALSVPYAYLYSVIFAVVFYLFLRHFMSVHTAFIFIMAVDLNIFHGDTHAIPNNSTFMLGLYMALVLLFWLKNDKTSADLLFWILAAASVLFRMDVGFSFGIAALLIAYVYLFIRHDKKRLIRFTVSGFITALIIILPCILYIKSHYDLSKWFKMFLSIVSSNQNWAYGELTDFEWLVFYLLTPVLVFLLFKLLTAKIRISSEQQILFYFLFLAFILNAPRTVVRHSLYEDIRFVTCILTVIVICLISVLIKKIDLNKIRAYLKDINANLIYMFLIVTVTMAVLNLSAAHETGYHMTKVGKSLNSPGVTNAILENKKIRSATDIVDLLLDDDETFFDFCNQTELFALTERDNPVYINQCPSLINGDDAQELIIDQIENSDKRVTLLFMSAEGWIWSDSSDKIKKTDRYYLLAEYIYDRYTPLYEDNYYKVWCLKECYEDYASKIPNRYLYSYKPEYTDHFVGYIPYLWGNLDNTVLSPCDIDQLVPGELTYSSNTKSIFFQLSSEQPEVKVLELTYGNGSSDTYFFYVVPGTHYYRFRVSSNYNWYRSSLSDIRIKNTDTDPRFYTAPY